MVRGVEGWRGDLTVSEKSVKNVAFVTGKRHEYLWSAGGPTLSSGTECEVGMDLPSPPGAPQNVQAVPGDAKVMPTWQAPSSWGAWTAKGFGIQVRDETALWDGIPDIFPPPTATTQTPVRQSIRTLPVFQNGETHDLRMYAWTLKSGTDGSSGNRFLLSDESTVVTVTVNSAVEPVERHYRLRRALHLGALARHPSGNGAVANDAAAVSDPTTVWVAVIRRGTTASQTISSLSNGIAHKMRLAYFLTDLTGSDWVFNTGTPAPHGLAVRLPEPGDGGRLCDGDGQAEFGDSKRRDDSDGGDGDHGRDRGLRDADVHSCSSHGTKDSQERGMAVFLAWDPNPSDRGPSFSVSHALGTAAAGGLDALLNPTTMEGLGADDGSREHQQFATRLAFGFPAFGDRLTVTPALGLALSPEHTTTSLQWALTPYTGTGQVDEPWAISLKGQQQEDRTTVSPVDHSLKLRFSLLF